MACAALWEERPADFHCVSRESGRQNIAAPLAQNNHIAPVSAPSPLTWWGKGEGRAPAAGSSRLNHARSSFR